MKEDGKQQGIEGGMGNLGMLLVEKVIGNNNTVPQSAISQNPEENEVKGHAHWFEPEEYGVFDKNDVESVLKRATMMEFELGEAINLSREEMLKIVMMKFEKDEKRICNLLKLALKHLKDDPTLPELDQLKRFEKREVVIAWLAQYKKKK